MSETVQVASLKQETNITKINYKEILFRLLQVKSKRLLKSLSEAERRIILEEWEKWLRKP